MFSGDNSNDRTLTALRIFRLRHKDADLLMTLCRFLHRGDRLRFILFDQNDALCIREKTQRDLKALDDLIRMRAHQLVIAGDVRLALRAVCDHIFDRRRILRGQLHICWEACAAHSDNTCRTDGSKDFLAVQLCIIYLFSNALRQGVLAIVLDHDRHHTGAHYGTAVLHCLHLTGTGADNVCGDESVRLSDHLPCENLVILLYDRLCGLADMLADRKDQIALREIYLKSSVSGVFLLILRMHSAAKRQFTHIHYPFC